jgi:HK97 family phage major capsid protein
MNIDQMERDLLKKTGEAAALFEKTAKECQAYEEKNDKGEVTVKGRLFTAEEKKAVQDLIDQGTALKAKIASAKGDANMAAEIEKLQAGMIVPASPGQTRHVTKSIGQQYVESALGQFFLKKQHRGHKTWNTPIAELFDVHAATLTSDAASGGDLVIADTRPGILPLLFKRLTVRDLLAPGSTDSNSVSYMKETTFTNAAATVVEATGDKPQSTLIFDLVNELVQTIAHWLPVTEQMLEDVSQIRSYIDARLKLGLALTEEDQLLNGDGTAPNISGILDRTITAAQARGADTNVDAIFKAMMKVFNASLVMPDAHVINPTNWQTIQLSKDTNGQYYGLGPFAGPQPPTLWGLPVAVTPSIVANTSLTGGFRSSAQIFDHGAVRVDVSNSHSDFFIKNLVAIRVEERLALAVYRPLAFGTATGLN